MSSITHFLNDKVLFVTGATGFVAKGLVEKLLRHALDVERIYLMIRPRTRSNGICITAEERLEREVIGSSAFARLRKQWGPKFESVVRGKFVAVAGDLAKERLGIAPERYAQLAREVDIVLSIAGNVGFDEPIDLALEQNTLGPGRIVEFAKACRDAIFVHVSTAYVNGQQTGLIPEAALPADRTVAQLIGNGQTRKYDLESEIASIQQFSQQVREASKRPELQEKLRRTLKRQNRGKRVTEHRLAHQLEALRMRWIHRQLVEEGMARARRLGWHDCYTLTKAMGEQLITKTRGNLSTAIVRPSIIESSLLDPEPGWLDGLKVADPLIAHYSKGRLPDFPADPGIVIDLIPVDVVVNAILAALPRVREGKDIQVYHVATGSQNPVRVGEMFDLVYDYFKKHPMQDREGKPIKVQRWRFPSREKFRRRCRLKYQLPLNTLIWLMEHLPVIPWSSRLRRKVSVLEATLDRVLSLSEIYSSYTHLNCEFETENTVRLFREMDPEDQKVFNLDVSRIHWREYIQDIHIPGLKRHVLKSSEAPSLPSGTRPPSFPQQVEAD